MVIEKNGALISLRGSDYFEFRNNDYGVFRMEAEGEEVKIIFDMTSNPKYPQKQILFTIPAVERRYWYQSIIDFDEEKEKVIVEIKNWNGFSDITSTETWQVAVSHHGAKLIIRKI